VGAISNGSDAVAIGHGASAAGAGAMAIGPGAVASNDGAIALGAGSVTAAAVATAGVTINGTDYDFAGTDPASVVSMGGGLVGARQVTNVAAGRISAGSTDAINGSQLFATNLALTSLGDVIENINNGAGIVYFHANGGPSPIMPDSQAAGLGSVAVGPAAVSTGADSVALGNGAGSGGQGSTALGAGAQAMQDGDVALGQGAVADGGAQSYTGKYSGAQNTTAGTVSVGVAGAERTISNVADGKEATDAVNLRQLDGAVQAANDYTDSQISNVVNNVNNGSTGMFQVSQDNNAPPPSPTGANSAAGGTGAVASGANSTAVGNDSVASGTDSTALGNGATASADNSVALGQGSVADRANSVSVGAAGSERQITHVAAGVLSATSTDAVNGSQLYGTNQTVNNIVNGKAGLVQQVTNNAPVTIAKDSGGTVVNVSGQDGDRIISGVADGQAPNDAATVGQLNQLGQGTGQQINRLDDRIDKAENRSNAGIAAALATAGLPQAYLPGKSMFSVGGGTWNGETGYAMGLSTVSDNGKWLVKGTASTSSRGDVGGSVGVGYQW
jgi:autotransporter adhesin